MIKATMHMPKIRLSHTTLLALALLFIAATSFSFFITTPTAYAATECGGEKTAVIECGGSTNGVWALLLLIINIMTAGVGILAVGGIVYASVLWTTAEDKQDQVNKAKNMITNTVIGIVAFALMWSGLQFIIPGGVFDRNYSVGSVQNQTGNLPGTDGNSPSTNTDSGNTNSGSGGSSTLTTADIKTVKNLRDASVTSGGKIIKPKTLYRSAQLSNLTPTNAKKLGKLLGSNALIIDLRPPDGDFTDPDKDVPGVRNLNLPIKGVHNTKPMVNDEKRAKTLVRVLRTAANTKGPVLIHCVAGKDRTGWTVAMIMYINGATDAQVMKEYLKSNEAIPGGVQPDWLRDGVQAARSQYGTIIKYLKHYGLTNSDLNLLKKKFGA